MRSPAEGGAHVGGQRAHIGPGGALHLDAHHPRLSRRAHVEAVDDDTPRLPADLDAGPGQLVEPLPPHLDGGDHGRNLVDGSHEALRHLPDVLQ